MTFDLTGKRVLVTGGGTGIGRSVALELARAGADVAITYRTHDAAPVVEEIAGLGRTAVAHPMDATDSADVDRVVARAAADLGAGSTSWSTTPAGSSGGCRWPRCPTSTGTPCST